MNLYSDKSFYKMFFTSVIIKIMIILVGLINPFTVCITIKTIPILPIWNYSHLLLRILCSSFFLSYHYCFIPTSYFIHLPMQVHLFICLLLIDYRIVMRNKSSEWLYYIELGLNSISSKCLENMKTVYQDENNVVLDENSVEWKPCINRESKSNELTI